VEGVQAKGELLQKEISRSSSFPGFRAVRLLSLGSARVGTWRKAYAHSQEHPALALLLRYLFDGHRALDKQSSSRTGRSEVYCVVAFYESAEQLDVEPAKYFVRVTKREKRACPHCPEQGVACAPLPPRIIEKSLASDRLIIDTIVNKYADHLPLYRQSAILERDTGVELSRATLCGWVMRVGELLRPVSRVMAEELLGGDYLQADETPVGVQMHDGRGQNHQAYLWQYSRPGGMVIFEFQLSRGREGPKRFLGNFDGILQTDGYSGYDRVGGPKLIHAGCWAHARRYFF
jgi:transposase